VRVNGRMVSLHKVPAVYLEMWMQIQHDYPGLPDPMTLKMHQIRSYYRFLIPGLKKMTAKKD